MSLAQADLTKRETQRKKFPRLFLANRGETWPPLGEIFVLWPDRAPSAVVGLSEVGVLIQAQGALGVLKLGDRIEIKIRVSHQAPQNLTVKVLRMTANTILLAFDSIGTVSRLKIEQGLRETLIRQSWRQVSVANLHPQFATSRWWHSVFDSNIWIWEDSSGKIQKMILEFEGVVAIVHDQEMVRYIKAPPSFDEAKGYAGPICEPLPNKVEPGHNWVDRFVKVIEMSRLPEAIADQICQKLPRPEVKLHV